MLNCVDSFIPFSILILQLSDLLTVVGGRLTIDTASDFKVNSRHLFKALMNHSHILIIQKFQLLECSCPLYCKDSNYQVFDAGDAVDFLVKCTLKTSSGANWTY